ncbi:MAG: NADH dehydrogenase ubiquinone Fe-S protein 4, partial [Pseudomonadota bacterium]
MSNARIYKPAGTAMQSGPGDDHWILEFAPSERKTIDPLMGWTSSGDTRTQVKMKFDTKD